MNVLVTGGYVLTMDSDNTKHERGDVFIVDDLIAGVGPVGAFVDRDVDLTIDASGKIVMPGLVNAHFHSGERLLRGAVSGYPNELWNLLVYPSVVPSLQFDPRLMYLSTALSATESLRYGVTSIHDQSREWWDSQHPELETAYFQAYLDVGIRVSVGLDVTDIPWHESIWRLSDTLPGEVLSVVMSQEHDSHWRTTSLHETIDAVEAYVTKWQHRDGLVTCSVNPSAPQRCSDDLLVALAHVARTQGVPFTMHLLETRLQYAMSHDARFKGSMVRHLRDLGLLWPQASYAHAIWVSGRELDMLAEGGCTVVHMPVSNQYLGSGLMPYAEIHSRGLNMSMGTDGLAGSGRASMFDSLRAAALMHTLATADYRLWPAPLDVLRMATSDGAFGLGLPDHVGSLETGKKADLIVLNASSQPFVPCYDVVEHLVFVESGDSIETVIVNGRVVVEQGVVTTVDESQLLEEAVGYQGMLDDYQRRVGEAQGLLYPHVAALYREAADITKRYFAATSRDERLGLAPESSFVRDSAKEGRSS